MKVGIVGLANSGKTTVFNSLTGLEVAVTEYQTKESSPNVGIVKVPDERVDSLTAAYEPAKVTYATVEYIDDAGIVRGDAVQNRRVVDMIKDVDALLHVVRVFADPSIPHPLDTVDPKRDASILALELIISDLELVEKRLERMAEGARKGKKPDEAEKALLERCRTILEEEKPLREVDFSEAEQAAMRHLQFISLKPELIILNTDEGDDGDGGLAEDLAERYGVPAMAVPGKMEMEISQLDPAEAAMFLEDLGLAGSAMDRVVRLCYGHLGLISFLTVGKDEVRAWTIHKGTSAPVAAGKVHSDIQRGFIRAEVVAYDDFTDAGSMAAARERGKVRQEGKGYIVQDGDIINFKFNV